MSRHQDMGEHIDRPPTTEPASPQLNELAEVRAELAALRAELDGMRAASATDGEESSSPGGGVASRRTALRLAGAAAVGAVAATVGSVNPAAADDPNDLTLGQSKTTAGYTAGTFTTPAIPTADAFQFKVGSTPTTGIFGVQGKSVLAVSTNNQGMPNALRAVSTANGVAISASGTYYGLIAEAARFAGVAARGPYGLQATGTDMSASFASGSYGAIQFAPAPDHQLDSTPYTGGILDAIVERPNGDAFFDPVSLWYSTQRGTDGRWLKIAGKGTAGALHPIAPVRVYDSRRPLPTPGILATGASRIVSVADGRNIADGAVATANVVPATATAVVYNVTAIDTVGRGFLTVNPGNVTAVGAASVNWGSGGMVVGNASMVALDADRKLNVICGGGGDAAAHFTIDVVGYYL
jgi:hypothetical protein